MIKYAEFRKNTGEIPIIDRTDRKIIAALQSDGRVTNADLAEELGLSTSACHRRVKSLEASGVIERYCAVVNPSKLGLKALAFVVVKLESHSEKVLDDFEKFIGRMDEVVECYAISGVGDYILKVAAPDIEAFAEIAIKRLARFSGVNDLSSNFVLSTLKQAPGWPVNA